MCGSFKENLSVDRAVNFGGVGYLILIYVLVFKVHFINEFWTPEKTSEKSC